MNSPHSTAQLNLTRSILHSGYDRIHCWINPVSARIDDWAYLFPCKLLLTRCDCFSEPSVIRYNVHTKQCIGPTPIPQLAGYNEGDTAYRYAITSVSPTEDGRLLLVGHCLPYGAQDQWLRNGIQLVYAFWNPRDGSCTPPHPFPTVLKHCRLQAGNPTIRSIDDGRVMMLSAIPENEHKDAWSFTSAILGIRFHVKDNAIDIMEQSTPFSLEAHVKRAVEPDFIPFHGRTYWSIRTDDSGYAGISASWSEKPDTTPWTFDDGTWLGNYNTMSRFIILHDTLWLVYTRKGLHNDHIFRHRAPLLIGQVDTEKLCIIRDTEQILVPELGARLCNFTAANCSLGEGVVSVAEWMQTTDPDWHECTRCETYGADNRIWYVRIHSLT